MKIEVTRQEAAVMYVSKAVSLLDTACKVQGNFCNGCPMLDPSQKPQCLLQHFKAHLAY